MSEEVDINLLHLRSDEIRKLDAAGITTLEQIAMMSRNDLGLGKNRGDEIIQSAQNILCNRHITTIIISKDQKPKQIKIGSNRLDNVFATIIDKMWYVKFSGGKIEKETDGFVVIEENQTQPVLFENILRQAENFKNILDLKVVQEDKKKGITLPREEIVKFAQERGLEHFRKTVFEEIKGNELVKIAVSCALFSSSLEPIHVLIVGDPASAKTMIKDTLSQNFSDVQLVGANSTKAGLVINRTTGEEGALSFSDGKIVVADEFDKIPLQDVNYTLELLSNGKCRVDAGKIHETIESHFSLIALANPSGQVFTGNRELADQINLPPALMSRFALIVRAENVSGEDIRNLILTKFQMSGEIRRLAKHYDQWIKMSRFHVPQLKASGEAQITYAAEVQKLIEQFRQSPLRRDARMADYAIRLPAALAKSEFRNVNDDDLRQSLKIFKDCLFSWT